MIFYSFIKDFLFIYFLVFIPSQRPFLTSCTLFCMFVALIPFSWNFYSLFHNLRLLFLNYLLIFNIFFKVGRKLVIDFELIVKDNLFIDFLFELLSFLFILPSRLFCLVSTLFIYVFGIKVLFSDTLWNIFYSEWADSFFFEGFLSEIMIELIY